VEENISFSAGQAERIGQRIGIVALQDGGPAARAGLVVGDLIEKLDGKEIADASALATALAHHRPGDKMAISVLGPEGTSRTTSVTLGQLPGT
jgi:S1-C subfamily serine protease